MKKQIFSIVSFVMIVVVFTTSLSIANASETDILGKISQAISEVSNDDVATDGDVSKGTDTDASVGSDSNAEKPTTSVLVPSESKYETIAFSTTTEHTTIYTTVPETRLEVEVTHHTTHISSEITTLPDVVVTRAPDETVVDDDVAATTKKPAVYYETPSTGGTTSIFSEIISFLRNAFIAFIEFLIMIVDSIVNGFDFLSGLF